MGTIVVTTDQSANSSAAIRFAIYLAKERKASLVILHVYHVLKPLIWSDNAYQVYKLSLLQQIRHETTLFIKKIIKSMNLTEVDFQLVLIAHKDVTEGILQFTADSPCDYLCISTRGAGKVAKLFGTHTSKLILHAKVPVICIPSAHRKKECSSVLYASDMTDYKAELLKVVDFAKPLHAKLMLLHLNYKNEATLDKDLMEASIEKQLNYEVAVINSKRNTLNTLIQDICMEAKRLDPSVIAFFTHQSRSFLEKILLPSNAAEYSFYGRIPFISYRAESHD
ncbi:universal stress protein [Pedobacter gandavensis]|uniref:universal stress protein n=1 Tax=Pedobacter gandavensis TaxID=2679963 RepID=UPI002478A876|nr:universal stress protein [Pedobacter gandavensis]WGQ09840.1 universal stress protein [Pedobacter gandavensis]